MGLPKRYHSLKKVKTKAWYTGVILACQMLVKIYEQEEEREDCSCPFCDLIWHREAGCSRCPWVIYDGRECIGDETGCEGMFGVPDDPFYYRTFSFQDRVKRLNGWVKRSEKGLAKLKKGENNEI